ncbi:uncharacterized protein LOC105802483 isoform X2 [Gossypium raimondii]|nr:uncharacterized protein LOC105802483 isoform X2 [Gossypium raimondii]
MSVVSLSSAAISPNLNAEKREIERGETKKKERRGSSKSTCCSVRFLQKFLSIYAINLILIVWKNSYKGGGGQWRPCVNKSYEGYSKRTRKRSTLWPRCECSGWTQLKIQAHLLGMGPTQKNGPKILSKPDPDKNAKTRARPNPLVLIFILILYNF